MLEQRICESNSRLMGRYNQPYTSSTMWFSLMSLLIKQRWLLSRMSVLFMLNPQSTTGYIGHWKLSAKTNLVMEEWRT